MLNKPIKIDEQIKLGNQLIQRHTRDRNGKDNYNFYLGKQKVRSIEVKKEEKNVVF